MLQALCGTEILHGTHTLRLFLQGLVRLVLVHPLCYPRFAVTFQFNLSALVF